LKRLILMRHAKSDWSGASLTDHDRMLNKRGRSSAAALGEWLRKAAIIPDAVLCSSAARTRETYVRLNLGPDIDATFTRDLYLASEDQILDAIQRMTGDCLLVVGHNPGIGMAADAIVSIKPTHDQFRLYPTGAMFIVDFDVETWTEVRFGKAIARHFKVPRDL
jgi:phosphohistidine phosphatase